MAPDKGKTPKHYWGLVMRQNESIYISVFHKFKIHGVLKVPYQNWKELLKSWFMLLLTPALEHLLVNACIIMSRCCLQRLTREGDISFFLSPVYMYVHPCTTIQRNCTRRKIWSHATSPWHKKHIYVYSHPLHVSTMAKIHNFITMQFPLIILTALISSKEFGFHYILQLKKLGKQ